MDLLENNRLSLVALVLVVAYLVIASTSGVVFLGIAPLLLSIRAFTRRETLAPVAIIAAIGAFAIAIETLSQH